MMSKLAFFQRIFHDYPQLFRVLLFFTIGGGALMAISDASPFPIAHSDSSVGECPKKKVVVLGTGWAATSFLKNLKSSSFEVEVEVEVVSPPNYFAFTPLLPSVTNGTVEARSIVEPIRNIVNKSEKGSFGPSSLFLDPLDYQVKLFAESSNLQHNRAKHE